MCNFKTKIGILLTQSGNGKKESENETKDGL